MLISGVGLIPTYVPLIIQSDDMEPTKYYSLTAAAKGIGVSKRTLMYAYKNKNPRINRRKGGVMVFHIKSLN